MICKFKAGDKVRRLKEWQKGKWKLGSETCTVEWVHTDGYIHLLEDNLISNARTWDGTRFELIESATPYIRVIPPTKPRRELVPGVYGIVVIDRSADFNVYTHSTDDSKKIREAIEILKDIADVLEEQGAMK